MNLKKVNFLVMAITFCLLISCNKDDDTKPSTNDIETGSVTDIEGNTYKTVKIGNKYWMAENLRVTHYQNGDSILNVTNHEQWFNLSSGAWCHYNNNSDYDKTYGKLYNGHAILDDRDLCPAGWHVPTDSEWDTLISKLGGKDIAGGKLKEKGTNHWKSPNAGATNESGFSALPAGGRFPLSIGDNDTTKFASLNSSGYYWQIRIKPPNIIPEWRGLKYNEKGISIAGEYPISNNGLSVRCVQD